MDAFNLRLSNDNVRVSLLLDSDLLLIIKKVSVPEMGGHAFSKFFHGQICV